MSTQDRTEEIVIVGGGPAGAAAAVILAEAGRPVLLMERHREAHHKVCGEFLSFEAQLYLNRLGVSLDGLGASRISFVRLFHGRFMAEARLPFMGRGLSRKVLDDVLLRNARAAGAAVERGQSVRSICEEGQVLRVDCGQAGRPLARTLFLATGKHDIRGFKRPTAGTRSGFIGFKMHFRLAEPQRISLDGAVEIALLADGYAGLQLIEDGIANLCLLVTCEEFLRVRGRWENLLGSIAATCPHLACRLDGATPVFERPLSIFQIPYGFRYEPGPQPDRIFRLGDQAGVISSFSGDGISLALHSGCRAAASYLGGAEESAPFQRQFRSETGRPIRIASALNTLAASSGGRMLLMRLFQAWPSALRHMAGLTRLSREVLQGEPMP